MTSPRSMHHSSTLLAAIFSLFIAFTQTAVPAADAAKPAEKAVLRIGYLPITDHLTLIAQARTQFKAVAIEPVKFASWPELAEALKAEAIDGAFVLSPIALSLRQKGVPIKAILLGHRNGSVVTVKNTPDITKAENLKGKTIAIPSRFSTHNILIRKYLAEHGLDAEKDVKLLEMAPPEMVNALATGKVDAFIVAEPFGGQAELQKVGKVLVLSKDIWHDHICCILNLREKVIAAHPEAVQEFVTSLVDAGRFIEAHPDEAATLGNKLLGQKSAVIQHVLTEPKGRVTYDQLTPEAKDFAATQDYLVQFGIFKEKVDLAAYLDDRFAKTAYAALEKDEKAKP